MSVRDKAYNYVGGRGSGRSVTIGGGNTVISGGQHKLDGPEHLAPDDTTTLDASASRHGLLPKLPGDAAYRLTGTGVWVPKVLADNTDVSSATPTDQDVLTWDDYLQEWVPQAAAGGALDYEDLTDVDMTGITDGQIPVWDAYSGLWLPGDASGVTEITDLPTAETDTALRLAPDGAGGVEWAAGGGGGSGALVLLEQHTASASASLDFTTCISSTYDEYLIEVIGIIPATNATSLWMRFGTGAGPTWDTGSSYSTSAWRWISSGGQAISSLDPNTKIVIDGGNAIDTLRNNATYLGFNATYRMMNPNPGTLYPNVFGHSQWVNTVPAAEMAQVQARYNSHTSITGFQFLMSSGNITSGVIRVYGIAKS